MRVIRFLASWFVFAAFLFGITLLLGQLPRPEQIPGSIVLSVVLALLAFWPVMVYSEPKHTLALLSDHLISPKIPGFESPEAYHDLQQLVRRFCYPTLLFAWCASLYLLLDGETKLQVWPFPCLVGGALGFAVALGLHLSSRCFSAGRTLRRSSVGGL